MLGKPRNWFCYGQKKKIIPIKIDINPLGFINKLQALPIKYESANKYNKIHLSYILNILNVISKDKKLGKRFRAFIISRFCNSASYLDSNRNTEELIKLENFTKEEIEKIISEAIKNNQIYEAHTSRKLLVSFIHSQKKILDIDNNLINKFNAKFKNMLFIQRVSIFLLFLFVSLHGFSQNQSTFDSLRNILKITGNDTAKVNTLINLSFLFTNSNPDSVIYFANKALELAQKINFKKGEAGAFNKIGIGYAIKDDHVKALKFYNDALAIAENLGDKKEILFSLGNIGIVYEGISDYKSAEKYLTRAVDISEQIGNKKAMAQCNYSLGNIFSALGNYDKAITYYFKALKLFEEAGNRAGLSYSYSGIGHIYHYKGENNKAIDYYLKCLKIEEETENKSGIASANSSIGVIYSDEKKYELALEHYFKALKLSEEIGEKKYIASTANSIGKLYHDINNFDRALEYYFKSLSIREEINDKSGMAQCYNNIGDLYLFQKKTKEAKEQQLKALKLAQEINSNLQIVFAYLSLSKCDSALGNFFSAYEYYKLHSQYKDSILNENNNKQIAEIQTKYETEKKENKIELQKTQIEKKDAENKKQKVISYSVAGGLLLVILFAGLIFRSLNITKKQKHIIEKAKDEIGEQKRKVEEHQKEIIDSITYARRLQHAILPPTELIKKYFPDSFVLYNPKDIVAGDFYWMETCAPAKSGASVSDEEIVFIAAADCTGHGVPGAMVSVVCSNALNRAVKEFGLRDTGKILDKVTDLVLETFEKSASEVKDGMDISLLAYDMTSKQIQWSGANNPLWYIHNGQVVEIKADKQPIGKFDKRKSFTAHSIEHSDNSVFYLFTDGLPDQFGGPKGKKFMYKRFENNLSDISKLPMDEQRTVLEKAFQDWKGSLEQVDDVTVIGIKI